MPKSSEIERVIHSITELDFNGALSTIENTKRPNSLVSTCTLIYFAEIGVQLREIANALRTIRKVQIQDSLPHPE